MHSRVWRPEIDIVFFDPFPLHLPAQSSLIQLVWLAMLTPGCPPLCLPNAKIKSKWPRLPGFDVGAGDMNPSPDSWTASALLSEPSP